MEITVALLMQILGVGGVSGVTVAFFNYLIKNRHLDQKGFESLQTSWITEIHRMQLKHDELQVEISKWEQKYQDLTRTVETLRSELSLASKIYPDLPIPLWFKDKDGFMMSLNDAYEKAFLLPIGMTRADYIGFKDVKIWGPEVADIFEHNDNEAKDLGAASALIFERVEKNILNNYTFYKYPKYVDGILVGVGGIATPIRP